jgi:hypothetical protein
MSLGFDIANGELISARGCYYITGTAVTSIVGGTPMKIAGTTTMGCENYFTHSDNKLLYSGKSSIFIHAEATISITSTVNNVTFYPYIAVNGAVIVGTKSARKVATGGDVGNLVTIANQVINPGDYIEIWVDSDINTDMTAQFMTVTVVAIGE